MNRHILGTERLQKLIELFLYSVWENRAEIRDVGLTVVEVLKKFDAVTKSSENGKLSLEGIFSKLSIFIMSLKHGFRVT